MLKSANSDTMPVDDSQRPPQPVPRINVVPQPAPGKKGPAGMGARTNYSQVHTEPPPVPDAGASEQKSIPAKVGSAMQTQARPTLDDLVKASMASGISRAKIAEEARKQEKKDEDDKKEEKDSCMGSKTSSLSTDSATKIASALDYLSEVFKQASDGQPALGGGGGGPASLPVSMATASTPISEDSGKATAQNQPPMRPGMEAAMPGAGSNSMQTDAKTPPGGNAKMPDKTAMYAANLQRLGLKEAASASPFRAIATKATGMRGGPGSLASMPMSMGDLNALGASANAAHAAKFTPSVAGLQQGDALRRAQGVFGKADTNQLLAGMTPAAKAAPAAAQAASAAAPAAAASPGFFGGLKQRLSGMFGGGAPMLQPKMASLYNGNLERLGFKLAADGLDGSAPAGNSGSGLHTSASGESGGSPVGGMPQGPTGLIGSNQAAIDYTKGQAYANRKQDMSKYLSEPMMSAGTDKVLQNAFNRTSEAGPKIASARELLAHLYEEVGQ